MKGQFSFSAVEASQIRALLVEKMRAPKEKQKLLRQQMRNLGFFITDFTSSSSGFGPSEFDDLVRSGRIAVADVR